MFIIERDWKAPGDYFVGRAKEPGMGRGPSARHLSLASALLAAEHYYGQHGSKWHEQCPFCNGQLVKPQTHTKAAKRKAVKR